MFFIFNKFNIYFYIKGIYIILNMEDLKNNIKSSPNDTNLWCELGELLIKKNKMYKALKCFYRANELSPSNLLCKKIKRLEEELEIDTEDEEEINDTIDNKSKDFLGISSKSFFDMVLKNDMIKNKLSNPEFQKKILDNSENPGIMFEDNEILDVIKEMHSVYKTK